MEDWVLRGMARWPNVPALFGWLALNRRGQWLIQGEPITRPQIIETINRNYEPDAQGRWYFQNGPQRGYVALEAAPLILQVEGDGERLATHTGAVVQAPSRVCLDEQGALYLLTEWGAGLLRDADLDWALQRLMVDDTPLDESDLAAALALSSGSATCLTLSIAGRKLPVERLDESAIPAALGFVREPRPDPA